MFCRLMDWKLSLWNDISHKEAARRPVIDIPVNRDTSILEKGKTSNTEFYHLPVARPLNSKTILIEKQTKKQYPKLVKTTRDLPEWAVSDVLLECGYLVNIVTVGKWHIAA